MALDVSMIMRLVDRFTAPARKMEQSLDKISQKARKVEGGSRGFDKIAAGAKRAGTAIHRHYLNAMEKAGRATGSLIRSAGGLAVQWAKWGAVGATAAAGWFGVDMLKLASDFEQFGIVLTNIEGSSAKAKASMDWVRSFAEKTPYEVSQVMEAFVALRSYGIDPMSGSLQSLGNLASGTNKQLMQAVEMMADAQMGNFERLMEFQIRASKQGDKVAFSYSKNGKDMVKTARNSSSEIRKALFEIMDDRFGGMMDAQSKSLAGVWSNIKDKLGGFQLDIADAGIFDLIKAKAESLLATLSGMAKDGSLKAWATDISNGLEDMVNLAWRFATETDWRAVAGNVGTVAGAVVKVSGAILIAIGWAEKLANVLSNVIPTISLLSGNPVLKMRAEGHFEAQRRGNLKDPKKLNFLGSNKGPDAAAAIGMRPMKLPKTTKTSSLNQSLIQLDIRTPAGTEARAKPAKLAGNTKFALNRGKAMAGAA
jgi:phage tail tape-measure protein